MLETLSRGFQIASESLRGVRQLDEASIGESLSLVRTSLLEADVDFSVVQDFLARVRQRALGERVETRVRDAAGKLRRATPGQHFVGICEQELIQLMGPVDSSLKRANGALSVMLVGLQGVGKTTVAAKLARHLQKQGRRPLLVAADVARPAAVAQLQTLGASIDATVHAGSAGQLPAQICLAAAERARREGFDAIVYDTAGRLAVDDALMAELAVIAESVSPANTLLVCDALMGRDAVNVARHFGERIALDGVVLTKLDGDARGGAALSVKAVTGVPIKFLGTGETVDRFEAFRPEGLASRILGMGDIVGLVRDFEEVVDEKRAEEDAQRMLGGQFGLDDLLGQLKTIQKLGPLREVVAKLPMLGGVAEQVDERELVRVEAMIRSMTSRERAQPEIIEKSRAQRIAAGCGHKVKDVYDLVKRFDQMRSLMAQMGAAGGTGLMGRLAGAGGAGVDPTALLDGPRGRGGSTPRRRGADAARKKKRKQSRRSRKGKRR